MKYVFRIVLSGSSPLSLTIGYIIIRNKAASLDVDINALDREEFDNLRPVLYSEYELDFIYSNICCYGVIWLSLNTQMEVWLSKDFIDLSNFEYNSPVMDLYDFKKTFVFK